MKDNIVEKFNQLPLDLQQKVIKYIDSLLAQKELRRKKETEIRLGWRLKRVSGPVYRP